MTEREIFLAAIEIEDADKRAVFLDQACSNDELLRAKVEQLLEAHEQTSQFLETPAALQESSFDETVESGSLQEDDSCSIRASEEEEFLKYLQPAKQQGWLGKLGHYEVEEILGRGAFGIVAKAFDEKLHRVVAIKMMSPGIASTSPPRKRFLREARTAAAVNHENIAAIYAVEEEPIPYLVMEYVAGLTLQDRMRAKGPFAVEEVLEIGRQIASGLAAAHVVNLIHRDIKPSNILLNDSPIERAKISDFGLARAVDDASMTQSGVIAGTPMYMAPEQREVNSLDHRADLFSLGSVLYQMVSGRPPFRAANTVAVLKRVCDDEPRPIPDIIREAPPWLCAIISRLMEKDRELRFDSAQEVADLLEQCQRELQQSGKVDYSDTKFTKAASISPANKVSPERNSIQQFKWLLSGGMVALLVSCGFILVNQKRPDRESHLKNQSAERNSIDSDSSVIGPNVNTEGWHGWPTDAPAPAIALFDADQAMKHQEEWARYLGVPVEYVNSIGMKFRLIPPGEFMMGSTPEEIEAALVKAAKDELWLERHRSEGPQQKVILTQPYYIGTTEVTQSQYKQVMGTNPSHFAKGGKGQEVVDGLETSNHPVERVSWADAAEFCAKLSQKENFQPFYFRSGETVTPLTGTGYRLPTEAEWEQVCRAGTTTPFSNGANERDLIRIGWFGSNSGSGTHSVGELMTNPFGCFDLHGNVREWVQDSWDPTLYDSFSDDWTVNPYRRFELSPQRGLRGGDWSYPSLRCRSSTRNVGREFAPDNGIGFRVVLTVDSVSQRLNAETGFNQNVIDLLSIINIEKYSIRNGEWKREEGVLKSPRIEQEYSLLEIPYYPPEEYELSLLVERVSPVPEVLGIGLCVQDRHVMTVLDGWAGRASGLEMLDGENASGNVSSIRRRVFDKNKKHRIKCRVEKQRITVQVDGQRVIDFEGDLNRLSLPLPERRIPYTRNLYLAVNSVEYHFHEIQLAPLSPIRDPKQQGYLFRDPNLRAAEWALLSGGSVHYELFGRSLSIDNVSQLPDTPFKIVEIDLRRANVQGWEYVVLEDLDHLKRLTLPMRHVKTEEALESISKLSSLQELDLQMDVGQDGILSLSRIRELSKSLPNCLIKWKGGEYRLQQHVWSPDTPEPAIAPFDNEQAKQYQKEWAEYLGVPVEFENSIGMKFRLIPPGEFLMGSTREEISRAQTTVKNDAAWVRSLTNEGPQHKVILEHPLYFGVTEVTQSQFAELTGRNPSHFPIERNRENGVGDHNSGRYPIDSVSWNDAIDFCEKLSQVEHLDSLRSSFSLTANEFRLPTEAEWEYACRAGTTTQFSSGAQIEELTEVGWCGINSGGRTHQVKSLQANAFGLFDMHGNVWEWVRDGWDPAFFSNGLGKTVVNPYNPHSDGTHLVLRGGGWDSIPSFCRSAVRFAKPPSSTETSFGFRVVLPVDAARAQFATTKTRQATTDQTSLLFDGDGDYVHVPELSLPDTKAISMHVLASLLSDQPVHNSPVIYWRTEDQEFYLGPRVHSGRTFWRFFIVDQFGNSEWWDLSEANKGQIFLLNVQLNGKNPPSFRVNGKQVNPKKYETKPEDRSEKLLFPEGNMKTNGLNIGGRFDDQGEPQGSFRGKIYEVEISRVNQSDQSSTSKPNNETIALYHFDEGKGNRLIDASGNGKHGIILGAKWLNSKFDRLVKPRSSIDEVYIITTHTFTQPTHLYRSIM